MNRTVLWHQLNQQLSRKSQIRSGQAKATQGLIEAPDGRSAIEQLGQDADSAKPFCPILSCRLWPKGHRWLRRREVF